MQKKTDFFSRILYISEQCASIGTNYVWSLFEGGSRSPFVLFRPKHDVTLILRLELQFCRLFNIKRKLSVFYSIVELFQQIVETNWRYNYC